jgi:hypothetical protein
MNFWENGWIYTAKLMDQQRPSWNFIMNAILILSPCNLTTLVVVQQPQK